jgi:hypothetical protein
MWPVQWRRGPGSESPERDIGKDCQLAVAATLDRLASAFGAAPRGTRAGLVAVFAAVAEHLPAPLLEQLATLEHDEDSRLAAAALLTGELARGRSLTHEHLAQIAAVDAEALDFLSNAAEGPPGVQAIELVRELAISATH